MLRKFFLLILFAGLFCGITSTNSNAQDFMYDTDDADYKGSFFTGGNFGLQLGTVTMIDVSPQAGYYLLENISVGTGFTYQYISDRRYHPSLDINVYGGRFFTRAYLPFFNSLFAHGEIEYLWYKTDVFNSARRMEWIEVPSYLAGPGFRQFIGGRSSINLMVLWNFYESQYTMYSNPVIRVGFDLGL